MENNPYYDRLVEIGAPTEIADDPEFIRLVEADNVPLDIAAEAVIEQRKADQARLAQKARDDLLNRPDANTLAYNKMQAEIFDRQQAAARADVDAENAAALAAKRAEVDPLAQKLEIPTDQVLQTLQEFPDWSIDKALVALKSRQMYGTYAFEPSRDPDITQQVEALLTKARYEIQIDAENARAVALAMQQAELAEEAFRLAEMLRQENLRKDEAEKQAWAAWKDEKTAADDREATLAREKAIAAYEAAKNEKVPEGSGVAAFYARIGETDASEEERAAAAARGLLVELDKVWPVEGFTQRDKTQHLLLAVSAAVAVVAGVWWATRSSRKNRKQE